MSDYRRSTREIGLDKIPAEVANVLREYLEQYNLGDLLAKSEASVVTTSEKIKKGLFAAAPKPVNETAILTDRWLIVVYQENQKAPYARAMELQEIAVEDYEKSAAYSLIPDSGVTLTGLFGDVQPSSIFLPLEKNEAGEKFKSALIALTRQAKL